MVTLHYTAWDGSQRVRLSADQVFEKLAEHLSTTDDVQQAMDWLMRQGVEGENEKLKGLDDLVRDLREELRKRYRQFNLRSSLDELQQKLDDLLHQEKQTLARRRLSSNTSPGVSANNWRCSRATSSRTPRRNKRSTS